MSMYHLLSPYIFKLEPEKAHEMAHFTLSHILPLPLIQDIIANNYCVVDERLALNINGLNFYNSIGLAAGFDKNASMIRGLSALGFGFLELGTITKVAQEGNPKPRIFRFEKEQSLQNAMGFNNNGSSSVASALKSCYPYSIPLGINIGKNKIIAQSDALKNYENALLDCLNVGDYYTFNLSSPNTPNLRDLQNVKFVNELFSMAKSHTKKPLFLKISPDMKTDNMLKVVESAIKSGANGIIATNTTTDYTLLPNAKDSGGISGAVLKERSKATLKVLSEAFFGKATIISVGGIDSADEAYERILLGASLLQVYSGLIFKGPELCKSINKGILARLELDGFKSISEAIGAKLGKSAKMQRAKKRLDSVPYAKKASKAESSQATTKSRGRPKKINRKSADSITAQNSAESSQTSLDSSIEPNPKIG